MEYIQIGSVVRAKAGRDKNSYFVAVGIHGGFVEIADGKRHKLENPKRKNAKHISPTNAVIEPEGLTNKQLRKLINEFTTRNNEISQSWP